MEVVNPVFVLAGALFELVTIYLYVIPPTPASVEPLAAVCIDPVVFEPDTFPIDPLVGTLGPVLSKYTTCALLHADLSPLFEIVL